MTALEFQGLLEECVALPKHASGTDTGPRWSREIFLQNLHSAAPVDPNVPGQQCLGVPGEGYPCQEPVGEWRDKERQSYPATYPALPKALLLRKFAPGAVTSAPGDKRPRIPGGQRLSSSYLALPPSLTSEQLSQKKQFLFQLQVFWGVPVPPHQTAGSPPFRGPAEVLQFSSPIHPHLHSFTLIHSFTLTHYFTHAFIYSFICSFLPSLIYSLIHSFTHLLIHSFTHSHSHSSIYSFTHSFIHLLTHSFTHLLMYSFTH